MTKLIRYEAALSALAAARTLADVKDIRDKAEAMRAYARMAEDKQLEMDASDIRTRAEHKLGIMLRGTDRNKGTRGQLQGRDISSGAAMVEAPEDTVPTLKELGIPFKLSVRAQRLALVPEDKLEEAIVRARQRYESGAKHFSLDVAEIDKKQRRAEREAVLGAKQKALPDNKYGVILADPEWRFEPWSRETGMDRAADNHYPTSCLDVIKARGVPSIAADDCVLFLWAPAPMLPHALLVMAAWGFDYKSNLVWKKDRMGTGYWFRNWHEHVLVGTRGKIPAPAMGAQADSYFEAPRGEHSAKPKDLLEMIEQYFPTLPKIELNRRGPALPGWDAWGNEAETEAPPSLVEPAESVPSSPEAVGSPNCESAAQ